MAEAETDEIAPMKLSEASRLCGVRVQTLRFLAEDGVLPGVVRGRAGNVYLQNDAVPTWQQVLDLLQAQLTHHLRRAQRAHQRVASEIEAVGLDIAEALDHPLDPLGEDLDTFSPRSSSTSPLGAAIVRLEMESWSVRRYNEALREMVRLA